MPFAIDASDFIEVIRPALAAQDPHVLARTVRQRWHARQVCQLLAHYDVEVRRAAAVVLGLVGSMDDAVALTLALKDNDTQVNQMAENALWSIWFRAGRSEAAVHFNRGLACLAREDYSCAIQRFEDAFAVDPDFAEAYNQCAMAHYFLGQWDEAIADCRRTLGRIPTHFGAILGMGHCHAQKGELDQALTCYRRALVINPNMPAIARTIVSIQRQRMAVSLVAN